MEWQGLMPRDGPARLDRPGVRLVVPTSALATARDGLMASGMGLLASPLLLVHGRPGASFRFFCRNSAFLIAFRDMLGLAFLLARVGGFATAWHRNLPLFRGRKES